MNLNHCPVPLLSFIRKLMRHVCIALFAMALGSQTAKAEVRIGLSLPFTGVAEKLARQFLVGANLAIELHNERGGETFVLVTADDGCDSELTKLSAEDLADAKVSIITGILCNEAAYGLANYFKESGIPVLVAGAQSERIIKDRERSEWNVWRLSPGDKAVASFAADVLADRWADIPYAIVDDGTAFGRTMADEFRNLMEDRGLPPQFQDNFRPTQSTQARLVRRLKGAGITHAFVGAQAEDIALIGKNAEDLGIPITLFGGDVLAILPYLDPETVPSGNLLAGLELPASMRPEASELLVQLQARGIDPLDQIIKGFQAVEVAIAAIGESSGGRPEMIRNALTTKVFDTALGPVSFRPDGSNAISPFRLFVWENRAFELATQ
jgi:branched-chain amino acid transport system substrate-binding protein